MENPVTHVPGGATGPADQPDANQPAHASQGPPAPPPAGTYPATGQPAGAHPGAGQEGQGAGTSGSTSLGLEPPIAGLLAYAFGWISGLVILLTEKQNQAVRFHAAQSIALFGGLTVLGTVISVVSFIPVIGWILALAWILIGPVAVFLWIFMMIRAYNQVQTRLPLAANFADKIMGSVR